MAWSEELLCRLRGRVICQGWTTSSRGIIRILQRNSFLLVHALQKAVVISHQVVVLLFFLCFFLFCKMWGLLFHFLQLYQNSRANTTLSPELFHCIGFFWWYPALLMLFHWISQTSLKFDQWFAEYEELARKSRPVVGTFDYCQVRGGVDFWISSDYGCHLGLEAVKDLVTSWLTVTLLGGLVNKDGGHCSCKDLWVFFYGHVQDGSQGECDMVSFLFLLKWIHPFIYFIALGS